MLITDWLKKYNMIRPAFPATNFTFILATMERFLQLRTNIMRLAQIHLRRKDSHDPTAVLGLHIHRWIFLRGES